MVLCTKRYFKIFIRFWVTLFYLLCGEKREIFRFAIAILRRNAPIYSYTCWVPLKSGNYDSCRYVCNSRVSTKDTLSELTQRTKVIILLLIDSLAELCRNAVKTSLNIITLVAFHAVFKLRIVRVNVRSDRNASRRFHYHKIKNATLPPPPIPRRSSKLPSRRVKIRRKIDTDLISLN